MTHTTSPLQRWGAICALVAGVAFVVPLLFAFVILPAAGSGASHALYPEDFLPWMAAWGRARQAFWWATAMPFLLAAFGVPGALKRRQQAAMPVVAVVAARAGTLGLLACGIASLALVGGEMPLAQAYVSAQAEGRVEVAQALVAVYTWQRIRVGLLASISAVNHDRPSGHLDAGPPWWVCVPTASPRLGEGGGERRAPRCPSHHRSQVPSPSPIPGGGGTGWGKS